MLVIPTAKGQKLPKVASEKKREHTPRVPVATFRGLSLSVPRVKSIFDDEFVNAKQATVIKQLRQIIESKNPHEKKERPKPPPKPPVEKKEEVKDGKKAKPKKPKPPKVVKPKVVYTSMEMLPKESIDIIAGANEIFEEVQRKKFASHKLKSFTPDRYKEYNKAKRAAKKVCEGNGIFDDAAIFDEHAFNLKFDPRFYDEFKVQFPQPGDPVKIAPFSKTKVAHTKTVESIAIELLSKSKIRFSGDAQIILTAFLERLAIQLILNGIHNCIVSDRKIVKVEHAMNLSEGYYERNPFLGLALGSETLREYLKNPDKYKDDNDDDDLHFRLYIGEIFRDVRAKLISGALKLDGLPKDKHNLFAGMNVSLSLRSFCSDLLIELLGRFHKMLLMEKSWRTVKTVTPTLVDAYIKYIHAIFGVRYMTTHDFIRDVAQVYEKYATARAEKKKAQMEVAKKARQVQELKDEQKERMARELGEGDDARKPPTNKLAVDLRVARAEPATAPPIEIKKKPLTSSALPPDRDLRPVHTSVDLEDVKSGVGSSPADQSKQTDRRPPISGDRRVPDRSKQPAPRRQAHSEDGS